MAYSALYTVSSRSTAVSYSIPSASGETLLAFVTSKGRLSVESGSAGVDKFTLPAGWKVQGLWSSVATGDPRAVEGAVLVLSMQASGAVSGSIAWNGSAPGGLALNVLRFTGMKGVRGVAAARLNSQTVAFPGIATPAAPSGHAVRVAVGSMQQWDNPYGPSDFVPAGHTLRVNVQTSQDRSGFGSWMEPVPARMYVSEQSLSNAAPAMASGAARTSGWGVTLYVASTIGPAAPAITSPIGSVADLAAGFTLSWTHVGAQTGVRVRRQTGATVEYLTALTGGSWTSTPTTITTPVSSAMIPAGQFAAGGAVYDLGVATVGDATAPDLGDEAVVTVTSWAAPTATNVSVPLTTGGVVASRVPVVTATGTAGSGSTLNRMDVEVVDAVTGTVYAQGSHARDWWYAVPVEQALPNGASIKLRARAIQNGDQASAWIERGPWTVSAPTPPAPVVSVQPWTHPVSGLPGRRVTVSGIVTGASAGTVNLSRDGADLGSYPAEGTAASPGIITVDDYSLPPDDTVTYSATVADAAAPANTGPAASATTVFSLDLEQVQWLHDPLDPAGAVGVHLRAVGDAVHGTRTTAFQTLGSGSWLVRSLGRVDAAGSFELATLDGPSAEAALALLTSGRRLSLRVPRERDGLGGLSPRAPILFRVVSGVSVSYVVQGDVSWRRITFDWVAQ